MEHSIKTTDAQKSDIARLTNELKCSQMQLDTYLRAIVSGSKDAIQSGTYVLDEKGNLTLKDEPGNI